jgi:hypothetical protein
MVTQLSSACKGFQRGTISRRQLLGVGGLGFLGLSLPSFLQAANQAASKRKACAKSIIFLHQFGGPSQFETFDMKPDATEQIRGEFRPVKTKVGGISVCERLPRMAEVADKITLIHGIHHEMKNHNSATYYSLTGRSPALDDIRLRDTLDLFPAYGSVVDKLGPAKAGMPSFVSFPYVLRDGSITPGQHASFLGKGHDPLLITQDPNSADFRLPELSLPASMTPERLAHRKEVMNLVDQQSDLLETSLKARGIHDNYEKALAMLTTPVMKKAFDLSAEPETLRDRYGRTTYGQSCLLARRLVEAGATFINVYFAGRIGGQANGDGWDTHGFNNKPMAPILKNYLLPITNQVVPTLLDDLDSRGLLDSTLVVWMGEFGRSPRISNAAGRDHWPQCYTAMLAGGGVKRGYVHGSSDKRGAYPVNDPVRPEDIAATMFAALGIDPKVEVKDSLNRPLPISTGEVIYGIQN